MLEKEITNAIQEAVEAEGQSPELANKIIAWMQAAIDGNEDINNKESAFRRSGLCFDSTTVSTEDTYGS